MNAAAPQCTQETLSAPELFAGFERDGFRLRTTPSNLNGLYCVTAAGDCLTPVIVEGDRVFIERGAEPEHGDLALIEWAPDVVQSWYASERAEQWSARFGNIPMDRALKLAWDFPQSAPQWARSRYWVCKDNMSKNAKPLGVVRAVERNGIPLRGDIVYRPVGLAGMDQYAATQTYFAENDASVTGINAYITSGTLYIPTLLSSLGYTGIGAAAALQTDGTYLQFAALPVDSTGIITIMTSGQMTPVGTSLPTPTAYLCAFVYDVTGGAVGTQYGPFPNSTGHSGVQNLGGISNTVTTAPQQVAVHGEFPISVGHSYIAVLGIAPAFRAPGNFWNVSLAGTQIQVEAVKR